MPSRIGIRRRASAASWTSSGTPAELAAEQEDVVRLVAIVEIGKVRRGGEQNEPVSGPAAPVGKIAEGPVTYDGNGIQIVHAGAAEGPVGGGKAGGFDDVGLDAETGTQA